MVIQDTVEALEVMDEDVIRERTGAVISRGANVVALTLDDWLEIFPAASYAATVNEYVIEGERPVSE